MRRTDVYLTEKQVERLHVHASQEGVAITELIRRALDVYLAWDDPIYSPQPKQEERNGRFP